MDHEFPTKEGYVQFRGFNVWYKIVGEGEDQGKLPLLCLHGGPGAGSDYQEPLEAMAQTGRRVIFYDQLGAARSDHPRTPTCGRSISLSKNWVLSVRRWVWTGCTSSGSLGAGCWPWNMP